MLKDSQIEQFFKNQTIFLTGATGFIGKLLLEKLLRTCWDLKKIYVLMRPKKNIDPEQRFQELFDNPCFKTIKGKDLKSKVWLISGDCRKPLLGINPKDLDILKQETTCLLHLAANVSFEQTIKESSYNVSSTREVIELAKEISNLKVFVYVSTAYSNCTNTYIRERIYEPPIKAEAFLDLVKTCDKDTLEKTLSPLLDAWPNTYVFSKCLSEDLIKSSVTGIPTAIVRPVIITGAIQEPIPGWMDSCNGVIGLVFGAYMGVIRNFYAKKEIQVNLVPADVVCNCILAAAWEVANSNSLTLYNCVGKKISTEKFTNIMRSFYWEFPSTKYMWYIHFTITGNRLWYNVSMFRYLILGYVIDFILFLFGKPCIAAKKFKKLNKLLNLESYFSTHEWTFDEDNVMNLWTKMNDEDKKIFSFHTRIDWYEYLHNCALGIRLYLLKDPISTLPDGKTKLKILFVLHYAIVILLYYFTYVFGMFLIRQIF